MQKPSNRLTSPYISDYAGQKIAVICDKCGLSRRYDADALRERIGDHALPDLLKKIATAEGCPKVGNDYHDPCSIYYDSTRMKLPLRGE